MRRLVLTLLFLAQGAVASAAAPSREATLAQAGHAFRRGAIDSALALAGPIATAAAADRDTANEVRARLHLASALCVSGRLRESEAAARRALELARAAERPAPVRLALRWLAYALLGQGRLAETVPLYEELRDAALAANDTLGGAYANLGLGYVELENGDAGVAIDLYRRAAALFADGHETVAELDALVGLARALGREGRYGEMRLVYRDILKRGGGADASRVEAYALNNLAVYEFEAGDPSEAVRLWETALQRLAAQDDIFSSVTPALNLTSAHMELGRFDDAVAALAELRARVEREGYRLRLGAVLNQTGAVEAARGRDEEAAASFRLSLAETASPADARAEALVQLVRCLRRLGRGGEALAELERWQPRLREAVGRSWRGEMELARAEALAATGRHAEALPAAAAAAVAGRAAGFRRLQMGALLLRAGCETALAAPDSALAHLREAQGLWEALRGVPRDPQWRERRGALGSEIHLALARVLIARGDGDRGAGPAFDALQRYKARTLLERMLGPDAGAGGAAGPRPPVTLAELQGGVLAAGDLLLDFYAGDDGSLLFAVDRDTCAAVALPGAGRIAALAGLLLDAVAAPPVAPADAGAARQRERAAAALARELLGPVAPLVARSARVIVAPDGPLNRVPLELLPLPGDAGDAPAGAPLVADGRALFRVPSATVLASLRAAGPDRPAGRRGGILAVLGDAPQGDGPLPGAAAEVRWLRRRFRDVAAVADLCAPAAGETLAARAAGRAILHVATHAEANDQRPWNSRVLLRAGAPAAECWLDAADVAALRLPIRLAVISACESAGGRVLSGEGVIGLTGAFLSAGAGATVVSLWPVDDAATWRLMRAFYRELARGRTVADALGRARRRVSLDSETAHPFYWAGFVVVGDGAVTVAPATRSSPTIAGLAAAAGLAVAVALWPARRRTPDAGRPV